MSNQEKEIEDQIREMARLTMLSNKINPIQERNLKMYPMVFFNEVSKVVIDFDLSNGREMEHAPSGHPGQRYVEYRLSLDESAQNQLQTRLQHLESAVRNLFWIDTMVYVFFNDTKVFESERK